MSGPGAVFGRPSHSKIRATYGGTDHNISHIAAEVTLNITGDRRNQKETTADLRNRVVQYEIAEKEACKVIRTICQDASTMFGVSWNDADIEDLLSGVLVLGNLCKRIGYEKNEAVARAEEVRKQMLDLDKNKSDNVSSDLWGLIYVTPQHTQSLPCYCYLLTDKSTRTSDSKAAT